jgi:predicted RNase H-like nuclease (RuvC/YqgF family)
MAEHPDVTMNRLRTQNEELRAKISKQKAEIERLQRELLIQQGRAAMFEGAYRGHSDQPPPG